jgi:hypothetical protein
VYYNKNATFRKVYRLFFPHKKLIQSEETKIGGKIYVDLCGLQQ